MVVTSLAGCHGKNLKPLVDSDGDKVAVNAYPSVSPVEVRAVQRRFRGRHFAWIRADYHHSEVEGRVQAMRFDVGDRVAAGKTLLELDSIDYQLAVDEAQQATNYLSSI
jgi:multidrug efflux pump subunit AcrA (membrane-fusion protein)